MSDECTDQDMLDEQAEVAADMLRDAMVQLVEMGMDRRAMLAGLHAEIVTAMTQQFGGAVAAECFHRAIKRVENLPSSADAILALAPTAGRA